MVEPRTLQAPASIGACMAGLAIEDAVTVLHGGAGCDIKLHTLLRHHNPTGAVHHRVVCTKIAESDLVLNPGQVLSRAALDIARRNRARMVLVTAASFIEVAGIDRERVVEEIEEVLGLPCVYAYAPDFKGDLFDGYARATTEIVRRLLRESPERAERADRVNIVGYVHDRPLGDHSGNMAELRSLLRAIGLAVNAVVLDGSPVSALTDLRAADYVLAFPLGRDAAKLLATEAGQKRIDCPLPIGMQATAAFLSVVGQATGRDVKGVMADLEGRTRRMLRMVIEPLVGKRVALFSDGQKVAGLAGLCRDLSMRPVLLGILDNRAGLVPEDILDGVEVLKDPGQPTCLARISELARKREVDLVIGPAWEVATAHRAGLAAVEFGFPCKVWQPLHHCPYMGYEGVLAMASRVLEALRDR